MSGTGIRESGLRLDQARNLAGILTEPAGTPRAGVVLVTAGLTPKSGPFRLYAELARRLAGEGLLTLRFDLGGIGDSGQAHAGLPLRRRTELEIRAAVDHLSQGRALGGLLLGGLCSGAEDSFRYAELDDRVTGVFMIDPFGYPTPGWRRRDWLIRAARRGLILARLIPGERPGGAARPSLVDYEQMGHEECCRIMRALIARGAGMHFVYTGGMRESFNHKRQFQAMFPGIDFQGLASVDYFPQLRHTQVLAADRRLVIDSIARALASHPSRCRA